MTDLHLSDRYRQAKIITLVGASLNALLGIVKYLTGIWFHSHALMADGLHSFADLISDGMVIVASKFGSQNADADHPYGHQRFETAATLFLSLLLIFVGVGIISDAAVHIYQQNILKPSPWAFPIAALVTITNEILYFYTKRVGQKINSQLIVVNAWHHRADSWASLVVLIGIVGSLCGIIWLDSVAAIIVGFMIANMGREYGWHSVKELVDTGVSQEKLDQFLEFIAKVDGVHKIHQLRSRMMGNDIYLDLHVLVDPEISVSEGHYIAQHVHHGLIRKHPEIKDVTVHIDPEDDEPPLNRNANLVLPSRQKIEKLWLKPWQEKFGFIKNWRVHYLDNSLLIDLFIDSEIKSWDKLEKEIRTTIDNTKYKTWIRFYREYSKTIKSAGFDGTN